MAIATRLTLQTLMEGMDRLDASVIYATPWVSTFYHSRRGGKSFAADYHQKWYQQIPLVDAILPQKTNGKGGTTHLSYTYSHRSAVEPSYAAYVQTAKRIKARHREVEQVLAICVLLSKVVPTDPVGRCHTTAEDER